LLDLLDCLCVHSPSFIRVHKEPGIIRKTPRTGKTRKSPPPARPGRRLPQHSPTAPRTLPTARYGKGRRLRLPPARLVFARGGHPIEPTAGTYILRPTASSLTALLRFEHASVDANVVDLAGEESGSAPYRRPKCNQSESSSVCWDSGNRPLRHQVQGRVPGTPILVDRAAE